jgi:RHS repeat-associated protein
MPKKMILKKLTSCLLSIAVFFSGGFINIPLQAQEDFSSDEAVQEGSLTSVTDFFLDLINNENSPKDVTSEPATEPENQLTGEDLQQLLKDMETNGQDFQLSPEFEELLQQHLQELEQEKEQNQAEENPLDENLNNSTIIDQKPVKELPDINQDLTQDQEGDRFIIKYKDPDQKAQSVLQLQSGEKSLKAIKEMPNNRFDLYISQEEMNVDDFRALLKQKGVDSNIEYIQPDYQLTLSGLEELLQTEEPNIDAKEQNTGAVPEESSNLEPGEGENIEQEQPVNDTDHQSSLDPTLDPNQTPADIPGIYAPELTPLPTPLDINDPYYPEQWALQPTRIDPDTQHAISVGIDIESAWAQSRGADILIAILDTGMDINHPDLSANIWSNSAEILGNGIDDDNNGYIDDVQGWDFINHDPEVNTAGEWHATQLAGIIAAATGNNNGIAGIAPEVKILPLKIFENGVAYTSDIIAAIAYAEAQGAKIANCSWGSSANNPALTEAIAQSNLLFVTAAGNTRRNLDHHPVYPAALGLENTIAVAAINQAGRLSDFSNYGPESVDIAAPGENIFSTLPDGNYGANSGTSLAAPFVSGVAALLWSQHPDWSADQIKEHILASADSISGLQDKINAGRSLNAAATLGGTMPQTLIIDDPPREDVEPGDDSENYELYAENQVTSNTALPVARTGLATVAVGDKIYCIGGQVSLNSGYTNVVNIYNPETNTWATGTNMPIARSFFAAAVVGSKIYCIGGYNGSYLNTVQAYDTVANTWQTLTSMSTARQSSAAVEKGGIIYTFGGYNGNHLTTVEAYTITSNSWSTKGSLIYARSGALAFIHNNDIYVSGGYIGSLSAPQARADEEKYNPTNGNGTSVLTVFDSPNAAQPGAIYLYGYIFQGGGISYGNRIGAVSRYTRENGTQFSKLSILTSLSAARANISAVRVKEKVYFIGGETATGVTNLIETYDLGLEAKAPVPQTVIEFATAENSGKLYVLGGFDQSLWEKSQAVYEYDPYTDAWQRKADMPEARTYPQAVNLQGKIYVMSDDSTALEVYDPLTDAWTSQAPLNAARNQFALQACQNKLYIIGGYNASYTALLNTVQAYDPVTNTWSSQSSLPIALEAPRTAVIDDTLYVIGGYNASYGVNPQLFALTGNTWLEKQNAPSGIIDKAVSFQGKLYALHPSAGTQIYYPQENIWLSMTHIFPFTNLCGAVSLEDRIYFLPQNVGLTQDLWEYTPPSNSWARKKDYRTSKNFGIASLNGKVYTVGGWGDDDLVGLTAASVMKSLDVYDAASNTWETKASMTYPRMHLGAAVTVSGKLYAVGGAAAEGNGVAYAYIEEYNPLTNTWTTKSSTNFTARSQLAVVAVGDTVYAIGGRLSNSSSATNLVQAYNPATNTWTTKANLPVARMDAGAAVIDGKIYVVGGRSAYGGLPQNTVYEYNPSTNVWTTKQPMPYAAALAGVAAGGKLYVVGGESISGYPIKYVQEYDPKDNLWTNKDGPNFSRIGLGAAVIDTELYAFYGGEGNYNYSSRVLGLVESTPIDYMTGAMLHFGEEATNPSGNFSRTYADMEMDAPGFNISMKRTYNSMDTREDSVLGKGWTFGFSGSIKSYNDSTTKFIVRLPDGSGQVFSKNGSIYAAEDSRSTLVESGANRILTTKDQYKYTFNSNGFLTKMEDRYGNAVTLTVDSTGKITTLTDQVGRTYTFTYNSSNRLTQITDNSYSRNVQYGYNSYNQLTTATDPMGNITRYNYNADGYLYQIKDQDDNRLEYISYISVLGITLPKISQVINVFANTESYTYDNVYRSVTTTDAQGRLSTIWYDGANYPVKIKDTEGRFSYITYFNNGNKQFGEEKSTTDRYGNKTEYQRDANGNATKISYPDGTFKTYTYDAKNNLTSETDESGNKTFYVYDSTGTYLQKIVRPLNGTDTYSGNDAAFAVTAYTYYTSGTTAKGLLQSVTDPNGNATTYTYDSKGNPATMVSPGNRITTYTYNAIGWKIAEVSPENVRTEFVYDRNGLEVKRILKGGVSTGDAITRTVYDRQGNIIKIVSPNLYNAAYDNATTFAYSGNHGVRNYYTTASSRLIWQTDAGDNVTTYAYDSFGNLECEIKPNDSRILYTYDNLNRLTGVSFKENSASSPVLLTEYSYEVLSGGRTRKSEIRYLSYENNEDTAITRYAYDNRERLIRQDNPDGTYATIVYNPNGTMQTSTDERGYTTHYQYDGLNRLTEQWNPSESGASGQVLYTYTKKTYDKNGNIIRQDIGETLVEPRVTPTAGNLKCTIAYSYDANNQLTAQINYLSGEQASYTYNADGQVSQKITQAPDKAPAAIEMTYNYLGKVAEEKLHLRQGDLDNYASSSNTDIVLSTIYTYDKNGNILTQTRPDNTVIAYTYDVLNRPMGTSRPGIDENNAAVTLTGSLTYDWAGSILTETDPLGRVTTHIYNVREQEIRTTDALGNTSAKYYDRAGRVIAEVSANHYNPNLSLSQMNRTEYTYDLRDWLLSRQEAYLDPISQTWKNDVSKAYQYDAHGNLIKELGGEEYAQANGTSSAAKIQNGLGTEYTYDPANRVITIIDPVSQERGLSFTQRNTYDAFGRKISQTDAQGSITEYLYTSSPATNPSEWTIETKIDGQLVQTQTYTPSSGSLTETDGNGNVTLYETNVWGKPRNVTYPGDASQPSLKITYQYDKLGNLTKSTDAEKPNGTSIWTDLAIDLYTYDKQGRELSHTRKKADNSQAVTTSARYDKAGNRRYSVDGNGVTTTITYDALNRLLTSSLSVSYPNTNPGIPVKTQTSSQAYDKNGNKISQSDWLGNTTIYAYDPLNRLIQTTNAYSSTIEQLRYNRNHQQTESIDALGHSTTYSYDSNNRLISTTDPAGHSQNQTYDHVGNILTQTDGNGNVTTTTYDNRNRLTSVANALGQITQYTYDNNNNRLTQTDGNGNTTTDQYNARNELNRHIAPQGIIGGAPNYTYDPAKTETRAYDAYGNLQTLTDRNGAVSTYAYDVHQRQLSQITQNAAQTASQSVTVTYDNNGNILTQADSSGVTSRTYDQLGRTTGKTVPGIGTFTFYYDITSQNQPAALQTLLQNQQVPALQSGEYLEIETDPFGSRTFKTYDKMGRLSRITADGLTTATTYNPDGSKQAILFPDGSKEEYLYTTDGLLDTLVNRRANQSLIDAYIYTYDSAGNQTSKTENKGTTTYAYDSLNQLTGVVEPGSDGTKTTEYAYDQAGNRIRHDEWTGSNSANHTYTLYTYDEQNRLLDATSYTVFFGQYHLISKLDSYTYDPNGNQISHSQTDAQSGIITSIVTSQTYDLFNQLSQIQNPDGITTYAYNGEGQRIQKQHTPVGGNAETTRYAYIQDKVVLELDQNNQVQAQNLQGDHLIARKISAANGEQNLYYKYNGHGDVTSLTDIQIGDQKQKIYRYDYSQQLHGTYHGFDISAEIGQSYTFSFDAYVSEDTDLVGIGSSQIAKLENGVAQSITYPNSQKGSWQHFEVTGTATQTTIRALLYPTTTITTSAIPSQGTITYANVKFVETGTSQNLFPQVDHNSGFTVKGYGVFTASDLIAQYDYDAFGKIISQKKLPTVNNNVAYAGYLYDQESGYYYLNARYYDPVSARFLSEDTYTGNPGDPLSLNRYSYVKNSPVMYTDPTGHIPLPQVEGVHTTGQKVYGNEIDVAIFKQVLGIYADDFTYYHTTVDFQINTGVLTPNDLIVGGAGATGGVPEDPNSRKAKRLWGQDREGTRAAIGQWLDNLLYNIAKLPEPAKPATTSPATSTSTPATGSTANTGSSSLAQSAPQAGAASQAGNQAVYAPPPNTSYTIDDLAATFGNMSQSGSVYTLRTAGGRTVFDLNGQQDVWGEEVNQIKWLLDQLVSDYTASYYTDKLGFMNEAIWGVGGDTTIGSVTFASMVYLYGAATLGAWTGATNYGQVIEFAGPGEHLLDKVARERGLNRGGFGDYVEGSKHSIGRRGNDNYTEEELNDLADEYEAGGGAKGNIDDRRGKEAQRKAKEKGLPLYALPTDISTPSVNVKIPIRIPPIRVPIFFP